MSKHPLPCRFCGRMPHVSSFIYMSYGINETFYAYVVCQSDGCVAKSSAVVGYSTEDAINKWNEENKQGVTFKYTIDREV